MNFKLFLLTTTFLAIKPIFAHNPMDIEISSSIFQADIPEWTNRRKQEIFNEVSNALIEMYDIYLIEDVVVNQDTLLFVGQFHTLSNNIKWNILTEICKFTWLKKLYLSDNQIIELPAEIRNLTALTHLDLSDNALGQLPAEIGNLTALTDLHLSHNELTELIPEIRNLTALTHLDLSDNALGQLPAEIGNLTALTHLDLSDNALGQLPAEIGNLKALTDLDLSHNELTELIPEIRNLTELKKLNLSQNQLTDISREIVNCQELADLELYDNQLTALPREIGFLRELSSLDLSDNQLTELPAEIGNLVKLEQLCVERNNLQVLPPQIGGLIMLNCLDLSENSLTALPLEIGNLRNLQYLDLSDNNLMELPGAIGNLIKLDDINLKTNQLTRLPPQIANLIKLKSINLCDNNLSELPSQIGSLIALRTINLGGNLIRQVPITIRNLHQLEFIYLFDNPLEYTSETEDYWGRQELGFHFGDRLRVTDPNMQQMPSNTTKEGVYAELDAQQPLRLNREAIANLRLPDINVENVFSVDDMLETLGLIVTSLNLTDEQGAAYLSYEFLANDFASEANQSDYTNEEKVWLRIMPRLTGYIRELYGVALAPTDVQQWQMYDAQIPETQKVLTYIFEKIRDEADADTKILLFQQLVNGLTHCPTGQAESMNAVAYALSEKSYQTNDFVGQLGHCLAVKKNNAFTQAILIKGVSSTQNVHLISFYRKHLKEILGLNGSISSFAERLGPCGADPFAGNMWNVVKVFYEIFTPQQILNWAMEICETGFDMHTKEKLFQMQIAQRKALELDALKLKLDSACGLDIISEEEVYKICDELDKKEAEKNTAFQASDLDLMATTADISAGIQKLKSEIKSNQKIRFLNTGIICAYLYKEKLVQSDTDSRWTAYFTADPVNNENALITPDGMMRILIHMGLVIQN